MKMREYEKNDWRGTCEKCYKEFDFRNMFYFPKLGTMICYDDLKKENKIAWKQNEVE